MIKTGSYMYIRGTNIEVGIRRVSKDPENPYAQCVFRQGVRIYKKGKANINPKKHIMQKIPIPCLTATCDFDTRRGQLKKSFKYTTLEHRMPLKEGLFDVPTDPHLYDVHPCGSKFFHIMKGPTTEHLFTKKTLKLSIYGIYELTFPVLSYDAATGVCTFNTRPKRKAHVSVLRNTGTMNFLGKHCGKWPHVSDLVDVGFLKGSTIPVSIVIEHEDISLFKVRADDLIAFWIPHKEVQRNSTAYEHKAFVADDLVPLNKEIYVNGLPVPFQAYTTKEDKHKGFSHTHVYAVHEVNSKKYAWLVGTDHIDTKPKEDYKYLLHYKINEFMAFVSDLRRREAHMKTCPIAVA